MKLKICFVLFVFAFSYIAFSISDTLRDYCIDIIVMSLLVATPLGLFAIGLFRLFWFFKKPGNHFFGS